MVEPGPMGEWTFKDLAAHLLGWRDRTHRPGSKPRRRAGAPSQRRPWPADTRRRRDQRLDPGARTRIAPSRTVLRRDRRVLRPAGRRRWAALPEAPADRPGRLPLAGWHGRRRRRLGQPPARGARTLDPRLAAATRLTRSGADYTLRHDRDEHALARNGFQHGSRRHPHVPQLHRRGVVRFHLRRDVREPQPGRHARRHRAVPAGDRRRRGDGHQRGLGSAADVAADAGPQARRDPVRVRRAHGRSTRNASPGR